MTRFANRARFMNHSGALAKSYGKGMSVACVYVDMVYLFLTGWVGGFINLACYLSPNKQ